MWPWPGSVRHSRLQGIMFYKNLCVFQINQEVPSSEALENALSSATFRACGRQEMLSDGWVSPMGRKGQALVHEANACVGFCLQIEEKVLPAAVIKELMVEKIDAIEEKEMRQVNRREANQLRDELMMDLLPRAFTKSRRTQAYIDRHHGWLVIDGASSKGLEELTSRLRECLGSFSLGIPQVRHAPSPIMTGWLKGDTLPEGLELEDECELRDGEGVVRCKGQDLSSTEIVNHIDAGKQVTRLGLQWNSRLSFVLSDDLMIRRLRFLDIALDDLNDTETDEERFDAEFALMCGELRELIPAVFEWCGGVIEPGVSE